MHVRQAVFLVDSDGARTDDLRQDAPSPLIEVAPGLRFLDLALEEAARHGFTDILLLAGRLGEQVDSAYRGKTIHEASVDVIRDTERRGTGAALRSIAPRLEPWFLLAAGSSFFEINLRALTAQVGDGLDARLALREDAHSEHLAVELSGDRIVRFVDVDRGLALKFAGLSVLRRDGVLPYLDASASIERDVFPKLALNGRLEGRRFDNDFFDLGAAEAAPQVRAEGAGRRRRPAAFLDRDGTINVDNGYTHKPSDLAFVRGAPDAIRLLNEAGYFVFVVTNQAGVARGYYGEDDVRRFHAAMSEALAAEGAHIDAYYHCPYYGEGSVAQYAVDDHPDRKPNPGMLLRAMAQWPVERRGSFMIGDQESDVKAGERAGVKGFRFEGDDLERLVRAALAPSADEPNDRD